MPCAKCGKDYDGANYCPDCGAPVRVQCGQCGTFHSSRHCPNCGVPEPAYVPQPPPGAQQPPPQSQPPQAGGLRCPKCGGTHLHPVTETTGATVGKTKGFGVGKGCIGFILFGWVGWLCGLCGMGKGKTVGTTQSTTYWLCGNCGNKFRT